jgi:hypothetical protein
MWTGLLWFALLAAAGLSYPRRPRIAGALWIMLGVLSLTMNLQRNADSWLAPTPGLFMIGIGTWYLINYRNPHVRAKHVEYWTAKA